MPGSNHQPALQPCPYCHVAVKDDQLLSHILACTVRNEESAMVSSAQQQQGASPILSSIPAAAGTECLSDSFAAVLQQRASSREQSPLPRKVREEGSRDAFRSSTPQSDYDVAPDCSVSTATKTKDNRDSETLVRRVVLLEHALAATQRALRSQHKETEELKRSLDAFRKEWRRDTLVLSQSLPPAQASPSSSPPLLQHSPRGDSSGFTPRSHRFAPQVSQTSPAFLPPPEFPPKSSHTSALLGSSNPVASYGYRRSPSVASQLTMDTIVHMLQNQRPSTSIRMPKAWSERGL